jgi:hypothetical protein
MPWCRSPRRDVQKDDTRVISAPSAAISMFRRPVRWKWHTRPHISYNCTWSCRHVDPDIPRADVPRLIRVLHLFSAEHSSWPNPDSSRPTDFAFLLRDSHNLGTAIWELNNTSILPVRRMFALLVAGITHRFRLGIEAHETKSQVTRILIPQKELEIIILELGGTVAQIMPNLR